MYTYVCRAKNCGIRYEDFVNSTAPSAAIGLNLDIDGDFIESEAFAFLAIRSYLNLPISFPETTGVNKPCTGGLIYKFKEQ